MKTLSLTALIALLAIGMTAPSVAQRRSTGSSSSTASASHSSSAASSHNKGSSGAMRLDILKWPTYEGAELVEQACLSESQLKALAGKIPAGGWKHVRGLRYVAVASYRLRGSEPLKNVIAFYEPRVLAAGYTIFSKDFSEPGEATAIYAGPKEAFLVLTAENEGEEGRTLEIVSVEGPLDSLSSMGQMKQKAMGTKAATRGSQSAPKPVGKRR